MATAVNGVIPAGSTAPAFTLPLLGGSSAAVPDRAAKGLTLVVFFKNTCPTCRLALPFLERLHRQVAPAGGRVVGVSQDGMEGAASFARELDLTMPLMVDGPDYPVSRLYDLVSVPTLLLVSKEGSVLLSGVGFSREGLEAMAADLASSVGAPRPALFREGESVPDFKPG
jgi:peroxiredoxin